MRKLKAGRGEDSERIVWREILRSAESRYDHRLHGVLAVCRGLSCYEAAAIWGRSPRSIEYWIKRFNIEGIRGLWERARPGRPSHLTAAQRELLASDLRCGPEAAGYGAGKWTGRLLKRHLEENYRVATGMRQCQRFIRRLGNEAAVSEKN